MLTQCNFTKYHSKANKIYPCQIQSLGRNKVTHVPHIKYSLHKLLQILLLPNSVILLTVNYKVK